MFNSIISFIKSLFIRQPENKKEDWRDGLLPSPTDFRDIPMGAVSKEIVPLPETYRIPYILTIKNQDSKPYCVGYSSASLKEEKERREQNLIEFDGDWIYRECKKIDGLPNMAGTYYRAGLKVLQKIGAKPVGIEEGWDKYRIGGYILVSNDFRAIKQAIYEYGAVLAGFRGSNEGWSSAYIKPPKEGERIWGHAVLLIGYNKDYLIGQNSWGENFGEKGYFYISKDYSVTEAWAVLTDLPNNWKELLKDEDSKPKYFFENNLWIGQTNEEIKKLQEALKWLGLFPPSQKTTNYFGSITKQAVIDFQKRYSITPQSGYFGPLSRAKLNELFA